MGIIIEKNLLTFQLIFGIIKPQESVKKLKSPDLYMYTYMVNEPMQITERKKGIQAFFKKYIQDNGSPILYLNLKRYLFKAQFIIYNFD